MTNIQEKQELPIEAETTRREPTWFTNGENAQTANDLAEHYRTSRQSFLETPLSNNFESFQHKLDERTLVGNRLTELNPDLLNLHQRRQNEQNKLHVRTPKYQSKRPWFKIIGLSALAIFIGGAAGYGFANRDVLFSSIFENSKAVQLTNVMPHETVIQKKNIPIASLEVNDVRGTLNSMIPLVLSAQSADGADQVGLKISGLPDAAYLTAGKANEKGEWFLQPAEIKDVNLVVPRFDANQFAMEVAAVETTTGNLAAPIKEMRVEVDQPQITDKSELNLAATIAPVSAAPNNIAQPVPEAMPTSAALNSKADALLNEGDVAAARQYYLQAHELGDPNGTYGVGRTYDPQIFTSLKIEGLKPDPEKAATWYKLAVEKGNIAAKTALISLP